LILQAKKQNIIAESSVLTSMIISSSEDDKYLEQQKRRDLMNNAPKNVPCCCGCDENIKESNHFCSVTLKRVFTWCYDPNAEYAEGSGSVAPCRGCANKSSLQQSEGSSLKQDERKQKDQDSDDEVKDLTTGVVESQDETKSQRVMILDGEIEGIPFVEPFDDGFTNFPKDIQFSLRDDILPAISKW